MIVWKKFFFNVEKYIFSFKAQVQGVVKYSKERNGISYYIRIIPFSIRDIGKTGCRQITGQEVPTLAYPFVISNRSNLPHSYSLLYSSLLSKFNFQLVCYVLVINTNIVMSAYIPCLFSYSCHIPVISFFYFFFVLYYLVLLLFGLYNVLLYFYFLLFI